MFKVLPWIRALELCDRNYGVAEKILSAVVINVNDEFTKPSA
jgi:hypothetical protein